MPWLIPGLLASLLLWLMAPANADGSPMPWRLPVGRATLIGPFRFDRARPFAAGQRRGVDLAARRGAPVLAACAGRVTYAGPVPRGGRGVSVRCGALIATHLGLSRVRVGRGAVVLAGQRLGDVGPAGVVRLGARVAGRRWGYVDPLALLGRTPGPTPLVPGGRAPRAPAPTPAPVPVAARPLRWPAGHRVTRRVRAATTMFPAALPWAGIVLLAFGVGIHGALWRSRPGRRARAALGLLRAPG